MHIEVATKEFKEALSRAEKITGKNLSLPVLRCVLLIAGKEGISIRATNLDIGFEVRIPAKVKKEGVLAIPGDVLNALISNVHSSTITIEDVSGNAQVSFGENSTLVKTYASEDFPILPKVSKGNTFTLHADVLVSGLKSVWYGAATSSIKPELSSVYVYTEGQTLVFAATDSFRLAEKKIPIKHIDEFEPFLLPVKNVGELIRNLENTSSDVSITYNQNQAVFAWNKTYVTSRVIDGTFPDYGQLIPKEFQTEAVVLKQDLIDALKVSAIFSNTYQQVRFSIAPKEKKMIMETSNADIGENVLHIDAALSGEALDIHFNHRYISDALHVLSTDSVGLNFNGVGKPLVIRGVGDTTFTYLVMPMNR